MLTFSSQVTSDSLQPHELQHARLSCPLLSPRVCSNSHPLSQWCHPTILYSVAPFSARPHSFPASGTFPAELALHIRWPKYWSFSFSISPFNEYSSWFPFGLTGWISLKSKGVSQESSPTPQFKVINCSALSLLYGPTLISAHDYWKKHSFWLHIICQ